MARTGVFSAVGLALAAVLGAAPAASAETIALGPNSPLQPFHIWTVPAGVCGATFDLYGAEGSGGAGGARVTTTLAVTPGTPYYVFVGSWGTIGNGGYNGGGDASGNGVGGGGATDVRTGPSLSGRILVAGGGGGNAGPSGTAGLGGGGGAVGANGTSAPGFAPALGGGGGTATSGGTRGDGIVIAPDQPPNAGDGSPGTLGLGGAGGGDPSGGDPGLSDGGGGGGGLYGGGGGGAGHPGGGGGGGSSLAAGGTVTPTSGGQGKAIITYATSPTCGQAGGGGGGQTDGGGGGQTGGGADHTKPTLSGLTFSRYSFAAAKSGAAIGANTKRTPKIGTKISFTLSEPSLVRFTVERKARGRKLRGRCVKPGRSPRGKRCTRWTAVKGSFSFVGQAGKNSFTFRGRVGGKSLNPGDYRLGSKATDNAHNSAPLKRTGFKIVT